MLTISKETCVQWFLWTLFFGEIAFKLLSWLLSVVEKTDKKAPIVKSRTLVEREIIFPTNSRPEKSDSVIQRENPDKYPKAYLLIENIRQWVLESKQAQTCYLGVARTFVKQFRSKYLQNGRIDVPLTEDSIRIPNQQEIYDFFSKDWPTFLPSDAIYKKPSKGATIYLSKELLEILERDAVKEEQWGHILFTLVLHKLAEALVANILLPFTKSGAQYSCKEAAANLEYELLPQSDSEDDVWFVKFEKVGCLLEDHMFGGTLEVGGSASRPLDDNVRLVVSVPNHSSDETSRAVYDLSYSCSRGDSLLNCWTKRIRESVTQKRPVFPKFQSFRKDKSTVLVQNWHGPGVFGIGYMGKIKIHYL